MDQNIHHPNDKFMESLLSDIEKAREFFQSFLPDSLKNTLDLSGLEHYPHIFITYKSKDALFPWRGLLIDL